MLVQEFVKMFPPYTGILLMWHDGKFRKLKAQEILCDPALCKRALMKAEVVPSTNKIAIYTAKIPALHPEKT